MSRPGLFALSALALSVLAATCAALILIFSGERALTRLEDITCDLLFAAATLLPVFVLTAAYQKRRAEAEHSLLEGAKRKLEIAVNSMHQGLVMFDSDNRAVLLNTRYLEMYGLPSSLAAEGCLLRDLLQERKATGSFYGDVDSYIFELSKCGFYGTRIQTLQDGRTISVTCRPLADGGWVAIHEDITEHSKAERTARRIIETSIDLILITDRTGQFMDVSPSSNAILGYDRDEMIGRSALDFIFPADLEFTRDEMRAARIGNRKRSFETRYFHKQGHIVTLAWTGVWSPEEQRHFFIGRDMTRRNKAEEKLRDQKRELDAALNNMLHGLCLFDPTGRIVLFNRRYQELMEETSDFLMGLSLLTLWRHRKQKGKFAGHPDQAFSELMASIRLGKPSVKILERTDGRALRVIDQPMEGGGWVATFEDITEQRLTENERDQNRAFLDLIIDNVPSAIFVKDAADRKYVLVNRSAEELWGVPRDNIIGKTCEEVFSADEAEQIEGRADQLLGTTGPVFEERDIVTPQKGRRTIFCRRLVVQDKRGENRYLLGVVDDVTDRKAAQARIAHLAYFDALTELPNRTSFREQLENELAFVARGARLAVLYIDLDHFKRINDTLGHLIGDQLLRSVSTRLKSCLRECDLIARLGGDEFAIVQTNLQDAKDAELLAQRLRKEVLEVEHNLSGHCVTVDLSIGIALSPNDGTEAEELLKHADLALYGAKAEGRGTYRYFEPLMNEQMKRRRLLELDLRRALAEGQFELHYQPVVDLGSGQVAGCEALIRWRHPERGMIPPSEFIAVAEETGLIIPIGEWVVKKACNDAAKWSDHVAVAVNVSAIQFRNQNLPLLIAKCLAQSGLRPGRLEIEVTESVLMQDDETTLSMLHQLQTLGVSIAMDDFGTGYSSLSYLRSFPFDKIKIDRSFIADLAHGTDAAAIVQAILSLAKSLRMRTTAEGVETVEQRALLQMIGCDQIQGFLFSPAVPAAEISALLRICPDERIQRA